MSTFALVVIGVGACIGVVTSLLLRPDEPATSSAPPVRPPRQPRPRLVDPSGEPVEAATAALALPEAPPDVAPSPAVAEEAEPPSVPPARILRTGPPPLEGVPNTPTAWWRRLLSAAELFVIAVVLGVACAAAVGLAMVAMFGLLRGAVG